MNKKILKLIEQRLLVGERKYGHQNIINDGRDFLKEALEESLDLAVYVSAKLIEIINKEKQVGAKINMENDILILKREMKELQDVVAELSDALINTTKTHKVDLTDINNIKAEGVEVTPDEEFAAPVVTPKKRRRAKATT